MVKFAKKFAVGTAVAAAAGYVAGILTAPKSGKETREDIKDAANRSVFEAEKQLKKLHTELNTTLGKAKTQSSRAKGKAKIELDSAIQTAREVKEKARAVLSAVHEGDSDNKDLDSAIKDAKNAISHLKSYLKK